MQQGIKRPIVAFAAGMARAAFVVSAALSPLAMAAPFHPYQADWATLHLWHFDEREPPFMDWGSNRKPLWGLLQGASCCNPSLENFGSAVGFNWSPEFEHGTTKPYGPILLAQPEISSGQEDNVNPPFTIMGKDGAFTIEAIVKLQVLPSVGDSPGYAGDIVSMDDESRNNRVFLFRIERPGFVSFVPISGDGVRGGGLATIPTTGEDAINTHDWFHVAVTYDGKENTSDNLKLYWTRLRHDCGKANQIGRGTLTADLRGELGDFAIGNSGKYNDLGPFEFFPGLIDEVRISGIARKPHEFFFVPEEIRKLAEEQDYLKPPEVPSADLEVQQVFVDDVAVDRLPKDAPLSLGPGTRRMDFDFGFPTGASADPLAVKCRLEGLDEDWHPTARGMTFTFEMQDQAGATLARTTFSATRSSPGWETDVLDSPMVRRTEPLFIPEGTRRIQAIMSSGTPDTTGSWKIDDLWLTRSSARDDNLWANGDFRRGVRVDQIGGVPSGWERQGTEPGVARVVLADDPALGILDAGQNHSGRWTGRQDLRVTPAHGGETFLLSWSESFNVISGASLRATYTNVPPGKYTFRAISITGSGTTQLAFPIVIRQPYWKQPWFMPLVASAAVLLTGWGLFLNYQRRARNRIAAIRMASAVERDRARIARDMHDDLGTRVSLLKHAASVVRGTIDQDPERAGHQAARLESAASDLVRAMDGLVWAVNPSNDTLEHLAGHLSGVAQEIFRDAPVRLRFSIPTDFPAYQLSSDFRHHYSLVVKEALHNILKHAGPCEASLQLKLEGNMLVAIVTDTGAGFDPANPDAGNGLSNLVVRATEMRGTCEIESAPGKGTRVALRCPLPKVPLLSTS